MSEIDAICGRWMERRRAAIDKAHAEFMTAWEEKVDACNAKFMREQTAKADESLRRFKRKVDLLVWSVVAVVVGFLIVRAIHGPWGIIQ